MEQHLCNNFIHVTDVQSVFYLILLSIYTYTYIYCIYAIQLCMPSTLVIELLIIKQYDVVVWFLVFLSVIKKGKEKMKTHIKRMINYKLVKNEYFKLNIVCTMAVIQMQPYSYLMANAFFTFHFIVLFSFPFRCSFFGIVFQNVYLHANVCD